MRLDGRARRFGDDVNTDYIISSSRKRKTIDESFLKQYLFEGIDPAFAASVEPGDVIVAGRNFGCGSAMEVAATVILAAGIKAVLAQSFARAFFRNAINNGLMPIEVDTTSIQQGDRLVVSTLIDSPPEESESASAAGRASGGGAPRALKIDGLLMVTIARTGRQLVATPFPAIVQDILASGGLVPYLRREGRFRL